MASGCGHLRMLLASSLHTERHRACNSRSPPSTAAGRRAEAQTRRRLVGRERRSRAAPAPQRPLRALKARSPRARLSSLGRRSPERSRRRRALAAAESEPAGRGWVVPWRQWVPYVGALSASVKEAPLLGSSLSPHPPPPPKHHTSSTTAPSPPDIRDIRRQASTAAPPQHASRRPAHRSHRDHGSRSTSPFFCPPLGAVGRRTACVRSQPVLVLQAPSSIAA